MKRLLLGGILGVWALTGCTTTYVVRLANTDTIIAKTKPRLDARGYYVFKDARGNEVRINAMKVREIEAQ